MPEHNKKILAFPEKAIYIVYGIHHLIEKPATDEHPPASATAEYQQLQVWPALLFNSLCCNAYLHPSHY